MSIFMIVIWIWFNIFILTLYGLDILKIGYSKLDFILYALFPFIGVIALYPGMKRYISRYVDKFLILYINLKDKMKGEYNK